MSLLEGKLEARYAKSFGWNMKRNFVIGNIMMFNLTILLVKVATQYMYDLEPQALTCILPLYRQK
jgi:hypothetical protein